MSYPITVSLIPGLPEKPYRNGIGKYEGVVAHATDNYGDSDTGERNYEVTHFNNAFVHFFVDHDSITQCANTDYLAWGAGPNANPRFVHVELCQSHDAGQFQEAYKRYVWLLAKLLKDRNLGVSRKGTLWTHHDVTSVLGGTTHTDPDEYLAEHGVSVDKLVADVTAEYIGPVKVAPKQEPAPAPVAAAPVQPAKSIDELAQEVIKGTLGSGDARKKALGAQYDAVQAKVNEILSGKAAPAPQPKLPTTDELAHAVIDGKLGSGDARRQALGYRYDEVQARVNEILNAKPAAPQPSIHDLALKVIRGELGSGDARRQALGAQYDAVQAEVNRLMK